MKSEGSMKSEQSIYEEIFNEDTKSDGGNSDVVSDGGNSDVVSDGGNSDISTN